MAERVDSSYAQALDHSVIDPSARLHRLERQLAEIQRLCHFGSWEWDISTNVVTWSDELYRICDLATDEVEPTYEATIGLFHPEDRDMVTDTLHRAIAERSAWAVDARLVRPDGEVRWSQSRGDVTTAGGGVVQSMTVVTIDTTERRHSEQFLREFIGNASHAVGTPSAVIIQAAHVLADNSVGAKVHEQALGALVRQSKRLRQLSTDLFDLVALDKDAPSVMFGLSMLLTPVRLADMVRKAATVLPPGDSPSLTIDIDDDIAVLAEATEIERVFVNLFANAHAHGGPNVSVAARRVADEVIVDVRDDGVGFTEVDQRSLFAPFAKRGAGVEDEGSGLGLAIVQRLVEAFGGAISYCNAEPHGSVFTLRFSVA